MKTPLVSHQESNWLKLVFPGTAVTLMIAVIAKYLAQLPFLQVMGQMVIAIIIGMAWRMAFGVRDAAIPGIVFSSKRLLRIGIILLGMRLNFVELYQAGWQVIVISAGAIVLALTAVYGFCRMFGVSRDLGILTACGTAICGASAVAAISSQIKAKADETAVGTAVIAVLGTLFTIIYTLLYPLLGLSPESYGMFAGGTLHEVAHVIAAASAGGAGAEDIAVIVKLTRVALLVPTALVIGYFVHRTAGKDKGAKGAGGLSLSIFPWFILGFLAMSGVNTLGIVPDAAADLIVNAAYLLIGMAMAGLGMSVTVSAFGKLGLKPFAAGLIGTVILGLFGYLFVVIV